MEHKMLSLSDQIFDQLEYEILVGNFERDALLTETSLSEQLGVSRTPIREALRRLEAEHIIMTTNRGWQVLPLGSRARE